MTITEFLLSRIAEDEEVAREALEDQRAVPVGATIFHRSALTHIARHDPARVLAECAAKRGIVAGSRDYSPELEHGDNGEWAFDVALRALAAVYADHEEYKQEWAVA